jgi:pyruvate/2-oxoglutarate dehydrogenase complex dihydrolipoamide acyltransferase (E2) component
MAHEVAMPQLSQSVVEGEITRWMVRQGDVVELDQVLAEIVTDKVDVEMPSPVAGTVLKILVAEGETVGIGTPLLFIGEEGESLDEGVTSTGAVYSSLTASIVGADEKRQPADEAPAPAAPGGVARDGPVRAAPVARKLARDLGIDLETVAGSGPGGRITADDVRQAAAGLQAVPEDVPAAATPAPPVEPAAAGQQQLEYLPYTGRRRQIGNRLARAKQTIPHASVMEEIDVTDLVTLRAEQKEAAAGRGVKLTYLAYLVRAAVDTLQRNPLFNSTLEEDEARIAVKKFYNIGIAVDAPDGLVVPVLHAADRLDLLQTAEGITRLAEKARQGGLEPADVQGSTFTVSSVGGDAILFSAGVINAPEVALLNLHRIEQRPVVVGEEIAVRSMMYVTLTFDHRVLDGGHATSFMGDFKSRCEAVSDWACLPA